MDRKNKKTREEWNSSRRKQWTENIKEGEERQTCPRSTNRKILNFNGEV